MKTEQKKLAIKAAAKVIAPSMSGCGKSFETDCGISQKAG